MDASTDKQATSSQCWMSPDKITLLIPLTIVVPHFQHLSWYQSNTFAPYRCTMQKYVLWQPAVHKQGGIPNRALVYIQPITCALTYHHSVVRVSSTWFSRGSQALVTRLKNRQDVNLTKILWFWNARCKNYKLAGIKSNNDWYWTTSEQQAY